MDAKNCEALEKFRQAIAGSNTLQEKVRKIRGNPELVALGKENGFEFTEEDLFKLQKEAENEICCGRC